MLLNRCAGVCPYKPTRSITISPSDPDFKRGPWRRCTCRRTTSRNSQSDGLGMLMPDQYVGNALFSVSSDWMAHRRTLARFQDRYRQGCFWAWNSCSMRALACRRQASPNASQPLLSLNYHSGSQRTHCNAVLFLNGVKRCRLSSEISVTPQIGRASYRERV